MPTYNITGTAYYIEGFDFRIDADDEDQARQIAIASVERELNGYRFDPELQEVCVEVVQPV